MLRSGSKRRFPAVVLAIVILVGGFAQAQEKREDVLNVIPADSLFCVRINNFNDAFGKVDAFAQGIVPGPFSLSMMARMPLAQGLGDPELKNLDMSGDFAIFGAGIEGGVFIGGLIPVTDYAAFVEGNKNCGKADENGISKITMNEGKVDLAVITRAGDYALVTKADQYEQLAAIKKKLKGKNNLAGKLSRREKRLASNQPFWAYGNVNGALEMFKPMIEEGLGKIRSEIAKQQSSGNAPPVNLDKIIDIYAAIVNGVIGEIDYLQVAVNPSAKALRFNYSVSAVKNSALAGMYAKDTSGKEIGLLEYLKDDAILNMAFRTNKESTKASQEFIFDILKTVLKDAAGDIEKIKALSIESTEAMGHSQAFTLRSSSGTPPFEVESIIDIANVDLYEKNLAKQVALFEEGVFEKIISEFGIDLDLDLKIKTDADKYKGVSIDSTLISFGMSGEGKQAGDINKLIKAIYGDGFTVHDAFVDGKYISVIGKDGNALMHGMIDKVKSDQSKEVCSEVRQARKMLRTAQNADVIGTINILRYLQLAMGMVKHIEPGAEVPNFSGASTSNIAFAGYSANGKANIEVVIPKDQITEIIAAVKPKQVKAN